MEFSEKPKSIGAQAFNSAYPVICEFLGKSNSEAMHDFFFFSRKMHNYLQNEFVKKVRQDYDKIKNKGPMQFTYNPKVLWKCLQFFTQVGNEKVLKKLVVPTSYFDTTQENCDKNIYKYYLRLFNQKTKQQKLDILKNYIIRWNNWETFTYEIKKVIYTTKDNSKTKNKFYTNKATILGKKFVQDLLLLKDFIVDNIYSFKKNAFDENYISFLNKYELQD